MPNVDQIIEAADLKFLEFTPDMHGCMWCNNRRTTTDEEFKDTGLAWKCECGTVEHNGTKFPRIHGCPNWERSPWCDYEEYCKQGGDKSYFQWKANR